MLRHVEDPPPVPWVLDEQLDQIIMQDLAVLAAIDQLADSLSLNPRRGVKQYIKKAIKVKRWNCRKVVECSTVRRFVLETKGGFSRSCL